MYPKLADPLPWLGGPGGTAWPQGPRCRASWATSLPSASAPVPPPGWVWQGHHARPHHSAQGHAMPLWLYTKAGIVGNTGGWCCQGCGALQALVGPSCGRGGPTKAHAQGVACAAIWLRCGSVCHGIAKATQGIAPSCCKRSGELSLVPPSSVLPP